MTKRFPVILILLPIFIMFASANLRAQDEQVINDVFRQYQQALINNNGLEASMLLDSNTIAYYQNIGDDARYLDSASIASKPLIEELLILLIRVKLDKDSLLYYDGKDIIRLAIEKDLIGENIDNESIKKMDINGNFAKAYLIEDYDKVPIEQQMYFTFYKEKGEWKLNIVDFITKNATMISTYMMDGFESKTNLIDIIFKFGYEVKDISALYKPPYSRKSLIIAR